jgi:hypothetical protein
MGDSGKDINNKQGDSADSEKHNGNADKSQEYDSSNVKNSDNTYNNKQSVNEKISEDKNPKNPDTSSKQKTEKFVKSKSDKDSSSHEHEKNEENPYHFPVELEHNFVKLIKTNRDKITKGSAIVFGGFLILYGLVLVSASVTKVADNVIFGEDATADAFLILLGVLIIVAAFAQSILDKTSLSKISSELEVNEENSESDDNSKKGKENDNKVSDDNKDNIHGENKR